MKDLKKALVSALEGKPGFEKIAGGSTLAHKISRAWIGKMFKLLEKADKSPATYLMWQFIGDIEKLTCRHGEEALDNWTANVELGVIDSARSSNPGERFDGNYPGGAATPRTAQLEEAALIIETASDPLWHEFNFDPPATNSMCLLSYSHSLAVMPPR